MLALSHFVQRCVIIVWIILSLLLVYFGKQYTIRSVISQYVTTTKELSGAFDEGQRTELLQDIQRIIIEEKAYQFFISCKLFPAVVSPAYRGYLPSHNWLHVTFDTKPTD